MTNEKNTPIFEQYQQEIENSINIAVKKVKEGVTERKYIPAAKYPFFEIENELGGIVKKIAGFSDFEEELGLQIPPAHVANDFAFETFSLAKKIKTNPQTISSQIADAVNADENLEFLEKAEVAGPFVNIDLKKKKLYSSVIYDIAKMGDKYGESDINASKVAVIDFSSPNIAKPMGVGHLRSTIIGQALSNIYSKTGYTVINDNHLGDWGTQFGKLLFAYKNWGDEQKIAENPIRELKDLYVKFHDLSKDNPEMEDEARALFVKLENGDPELLTLWKKFRDLSVEDFDKMYKKLGVSFDTYIGESFFIKDAEAAVADCLEKKVCRIDEETGAVVVDGEDENTPSFLLRKQDGSTLYMSRDLAAIKFRCQTFNPDSILYVVGNEQELNFKQLFSLAKKIGYLSSQVEAKHIGFGMVTVGGKKMSTRQGTIIELEELLFQSVEKSKDILKEKNPNLNEQELAEISEIIGVGAILYNDLRQTKTKSISFDWNKMLDFEGSGSAAYLQYTYVRIQSILRKLTTVFGEIKELEKEEIIFEEKSEFELAKKLMMFPKIIVKAQKTDSPHIISTYLEELAPIFNSFYNEISIVKTENEKLRNSRVMLCQDTASIIKNGLSLLSIKVPEKM